jgi:hypothetical protein
LLPINRFIPIMNKLRVKSSAPFNAAAALIPEDKLLDSDMLMLPTPNDPLVEVPVLVLDVNAVRFISRNMQATSNPTTAFWSSVNVTVFTPATPVISAIDVSAKRFT